MQRNFRTQPLDKLCAKQASKLCWTTLLTEQLLYRINLTSGNPRLLFLRALSKYINNNTKRFVSLTTQASVLNATSPRLRAPITPMFRDSPAHNNKLLHSRFSPTRRNPKARGHQPCISTQRVSEHMVAWRPCASCVTSTTGPEPVALGRHHLVFP